MSNKNVQALNFVFLLIVCLRTEGGPTDSHGTSSSPSPHAHTNEEKLVRRLMRPYERSMRPVFNHTEAVTVRMSSTLSQIIDVDLRHQKVITTIWLDHEWVDQRLRWNPDEFSGVKVVRLPHTMVWLPDVVLYNSADDASSYQDSLVIVSFDGTVFWPPVVHLHSFCRMDVTYFPYDDQFFYLKFGSWSHSGDLVDVAIRNNGVDLSNYIPNGEWDLVEVKATRNVIYYPCCPEPFPDLTFYFHIRRRLLYYILNIILPTTTLSALALLAFCLPPHCSEKVTLSLTVLLAYTVFLMTVSESLPRTSEFLPIFSVFITLVMTVTAASTVCSIFVIQVRFRGRTGREPPAWLLTLARRGIFGSYLRIVRTAVLIFVSCASGRIYPINGASSDDEDGVAFSNASLGGETGISRKSGLLDPTEPLSMRQPKGLGVGRDEQEFLFTVIDEWDDERRDVHTTTSRSVTPTQMNESDLVWKHNRGGLAGNLGRRFAKHAQMPPPSLINNQQQQTPQKSSFIAHLNSTDGSYDGDEDDESVYDTLTKQPRQVNLDNLVTQENDFVHQDNHSITALSEGAVPLRRNCGTRKRILAYKRSPLWDRSSYICKTNASRYERNLTSMLRTLAKQQRLECRDVALEKLWTEVSAMLNRCFLTLFLLTNFAATVVVLVIIPYAKSDANIDTFIKSRNLINHTMAVNTSETLQSSSVLLSEHEEHDEQDEISDASAAAVVNNIITTTVKAAMKFADHEDEMIIGEQDSNSLDDDELIASSPVEHLFRRLFT